MAYSKPVYDYEFSKRDYSRRKNMIMFLASICDQYLYECDKLAPVSTHFSKMGENEKRRYSEAITAVSAWLDEMRELAYGEDGEFYNEEIPNDGERIDCDD